MPLLLAYKSHNGAYIRGMLLLVDVLELNNATFGGRSHL